MSTNIEWTDETWNPVVGCSIVSPGCHHCYAATMARRLRAMALADLAAGRDPGRKRHYIDAVTDEGRWTGKLVPVPEALIDPLKWKKPRKIFVNSMSDLFHEELPYEFIAAVFGAMAFAPQHTFQVLTKRAKNAVGFFEWVKRMADAHSTIPLQVCIHHLQRMSDDPLFRDLKRVSDPWQWPLKNVWLGVSVEDQKRADERIPFLLNIPAARRFLSIEPLLGPVNLARDIGGTLWIGGQRGCDCTHKGIGTAECPKHSHHHHDNRCKAGVDWVIVGGESGHNARPMHPDWVRSLRDQCQIADVPFLFKQWGEYGSRTVNLLSGENTFRQFTSFEHWVAKASTWVNGGICLDTSGRELKCGKDFKDASLHGRFPVTVMHRVGKSAAGRMLDGRTWDEFPTVRAETR